MRSLLTLLALLVSLSIARAESEGFIPFVRLLATPERYDGKKVAVYASSVVAFEVQGAFESRASASHPSNGVWLYYDFGPDVSSEEKWFRARIHGVFRAGKQGHMGMWSGAIDVETIELYPEESKTPNNSAQHNAGSRPPPSDLPESATPSAPAPRD